MIRREESSQRNSRIIMLITCYTPNSQDGLARLSYRMTGRMISGHI